MSKKRKAEDKQRKLNLIKQLRKDSIMEISENTQPDLDQQPAAAAVVDKKPILPLSDDVNKLTDELNKTTEFKEVQKSQPITWIPEEETSPLQLEPLEEDINTEKEEPTPSESKNLLSAETSAELFIGGLDVVQKQIFSAIIRYKARRKLGDKNKRIELQALADEVDQELKDILEIEMPERALIRLIQRAENKIDNLSIKDDEWDRLQEALEAVISEYPNYQLPPNLGLALAAGQIFLPRIIDALD